MTQKEKLYEQVLIVENEYKALKGDKHLVAIEGMKNSGILGMNAKGYSLAELKTRLAIAEKQVEAAKQAKAVEEYFSTPEGAKRKRILEEGREYNIEVMRHNRDYYVAEAKALIEPMLPENWKMYCTEVAYINIFLTNPVDGEKVFGHEFELRLNTEWDKEDKVIYTIASNMGTMGSFDPTRDIERVSLYKVFADIISNKQLIEDLKSVMIQADASKQKSRENIRIINNQLKNPLA